MSAEVAAPIITDSMLLASLDAARSYPDLKILCLHCNESVLGAMLRAHFNQHLLGSQPPPDHWEAL